MNTDIVTITLNPALDYTTSAPHVIPDHKLRCSEPTVDPGGGGVNVARTVVHLGGTATAFVATGGPTGARLLEALTDEGVPAVAFSAPGETRQSLTVNDAATGGQFRFVMPGPAWTADAVEQCLNKISDCARDDALVVLSGSLPPGVPDTFPVALAKRLAAHGAQSIIDTSGAALGRLAETNDRNPVDVLRMDRDEAEDLAGHPLPDRNATAAIARDLAQRGVARWVVIARGTDGSVMSNADESWHCAGAEVEVASKVGAGDSFVGAFVLAMARGKPQEECLRYGTAAASAAVMTEGTKLCDRETTERLLPECTLTRI